MICTTSQFISLAFLLSIAHGFAPQKGRVRFSSALPMSYLESLTGEAPPRSSKSYSPFGDYKKPGSSAVSSAASASTSKKSYSPFGSTPKAAAPVGGFQPGAATPSIEYEPTTAAAQGPSNPMKNYSPFGSTPKAAAPMGGYQPGTAAPSVEYAPATTATTAPTTQKKSYSPFGSAPKAAAPMGGHQPGASAPSIEYQPVTTASAEPTAQKKGYSPFGTTPKAAAPMGGYQPGASAPSVEYASATTVTAVPTTQKQSYSPFGSTPKAAAPMGGYQPGASAPSIEYQSVTIAADPTPVVQDQPQEVPTIIPSLAGPSDVTLHHYADSEFFSLDNLNDKGPRTTADVGEPFEKSRKMADDGSFRVGSWFCSEGGWNSPNPKAHTEIFYVLTGKGTLTDSDGKKHEFEAGDTVIIPKGHTGRWDIESAIHKVWAVNDHVKIEETSNPIRVQVFKDPTGFSPSKKGACGIFYNVGPTKVGLWASKEGSYPVEAQPIRTFFHMLEGLLYVTDAETGLAHRCEAGDTVILPAEWEGFIDVVEPVKKIWATGDVE